MSILTSITIATYNHASRLDATLASIFAQQVPFEFEVIVVDDGSTDDTPAVLAKYPEVKVTTVARAEGHRNPAPARNTAIAAAVGQVLIMQSDDVVHHTPDAIQRLTTLVLNHPKTAVFATVYNVLPDGSMAPGMPYVHPKQNRRPLFFLGAIRKDDIMLVGGNDEEFVGPGFEDRWLADCLQNGISCIWIFTPDVVGHHQDHTRPVETYGKFWKPDSAMRKLYEHKYTSAVAGLINWRAKISRLNPTDLNN